MSRIRKMFVILGVVVSRSPLQPISLLELQSRHTSRHRLARSRIVFNFMKWSSHSGYMPWPYR
jgi:hypothetical protein